MKYYIPTTTLNFSNILSSEAVSPACRYGLRTLGFNHFETSTPNPSQDCLFVYNHIPDWRTDTQVNDDYPLILEVDESAIPRSILTSALTEPEPIWATHKTVYLSPNTTRFLFRSMDEKKRMLSRVAATLENKCEDMYRAADRFALFLLGAAIPFASGTRDSLVEWGRLNPYDHSRDVITDVAQERTSGAELGASIGLWYRAHQEASQTPRNKATRLQTALGHFGITTDAFQNVLNQLGIPVAGLLKLVAEEQPSPYGPASRQSGVVLPNTETDDRRARAYRLLEAVNAFITERGNVVWRWDGTSIVEFCRSVWVEVLSPRVNEEKTFVAYRDSFNKLLRNLQKQGSYSICEERSPFLQAFAAVVIGGREEGKLARLIASEGVTCPEITLSLYGAIVGYSRFPRTLMDPEIYKGGLPPPPPPESPLQKAVTAFAEALGKMRKVPKERKETFMTTLMPSLLSGKSCIPEIRAWGEEAGVPKRTLSSFVRALELFVDHESPNKTANPSRSVKQLSAHTRKAFQAEPTQELLLFAEDQSSANNQPDRAHLFVEDKQCAHALRDDQAPSTHLDSETKQRLATAIGLFQKEYQPDGFYSRRPEEYQRDNKNALDHFLRCLSSKKTRMMNVPLTDDQKKALATWLANRYGQ